MRTRKESSCYQLCKINVSFRFTVANVRQRDHRSKACSQRRPSRSSLGLDVWLRIVAGVSLVPELLSRFIYNVDTS